MAGLIDDPECNPNPTSCLKDSECNPEQSCYVRRCENIGGTGQCFNAGPKAATGATVTDNLPAQLTAATWTCAASAGSACPASGSGDINASVDLAVGGTATFTLTATVSGTGTLSNTASIAPPTGPIRGTAKIRSRATDAPVTITADLAGGGATLDFDQPQRAITPGQAAVFYDGEVCLGGGWIEARPAPAPPAS